MLKKDRCTALFVQDGVQQQNVLGIREEIDLAVKHSYKPGVQSVSRLGQRPVSLSYNP